MIPGLRRAPANSQSLTKDVFYSLSFRPAPSVVLSILLDRPPHSICDAASYTDTDPSGRLTEAHGTTPPNRTRPVTRPSSSARYSALPLFRKHNPFKSSLPSLLTWNSVARFTQALSLDHPPLKFCPTQTRRRRRAGGGDWAPPDTVCFRDPRTKSSLEKQTIGA